MLVSSLEKATEFFGVIIMLLFVQISLPLISMHSLP